MKNKKLISLISAIAMTATVFTPFSFVDAATDVLWSDTFNSYENVGLKTDEDDPSIVPGSAEAVGPTLCQSYRTSATYDGIEGILMATAGGTGKGDDSSYFQLKEKADDANDKYVSTSVARFSNQGRGSYIKFDETYAPADGKDLVVAFDAMLQDATAESNLSYTPGIVIGNMQITNAITGAASEEWHSYKMVVNASGSTLYMDGSSVGVSADTTVSQINFQDPTATGDAQKAATHPIGYPVVGIDNVVVYNADNGETDETPAPETKGDVVTPKPTEAPVPAPEITVPAGNTTIINNNFNAASLGTIVSLGTEAQEAPATVDGINYYIGSRSSGADAASRARIALNAEGDNVLSLEAGKFATAGRGPVAELANDVSVIETGVASTMEFAVRLSSASDTGAGRLYFLKDRTQAGDDGTGAYRNVAYVLGTDDDVTAITRGDNGTDVIGQKVEAGVWHTVKFELGADQIYRVSVDGGEPFKGDYVASGENATMLEKLPLLAIQSSKGDGVNYYSIAEIDNLVAYYAVDSGETPMPTTPVTDPTDEPSKGVTLTPSQDTYVDSDDDVDHSAATAMKINKEKPTQKSIIGFDTTSLAGQTITKATLKVKVAPRSYKAADTRYENTGLTFAATTDAWESGILKNALDSLSATTVNKDLIWTEKFPAATEDIVAPYQDIEVDVTSALSEALKANSEMVSFIVTASSGRTHDIASMEDADNAPQLVVEVSGDTPVVTAKPTEQPTAEPSPVVTARPLPTAAPKVEGPTFDFTTKEVAEDGTATIVVSYKDVPEPVNIRGIQIKINIPAADYTVVDKKALVDGASINYSNTTGNMSVAYAETSADAKLPAAADLAEIKVKVNNLPNHDENYAFVTTNAKIETRTSDGTKVQYTVANNNLNVGIPAIEYKVPTGPTPKPTAKPTEGPTAKPAPGRPTAIPTAAPTDEPGPVVTAQPIPTAAPAVEGPAFTFTTKEVAEDGTATIVVSYKDVPEPVNIRGIQIKINIPAADYTVVDKKALVDGASINYSNTTGNMSVAYAETSADAKLPAAADLAEIKVKVNNLPNHDENYAFVTTNAKIETRTSDGAKVQYTVANNNLNVGVPAIEYKVPVVATPVPATPVPDKVVVAVKDGFTDAQITEIGKDESGNQYLVIEAVDKDGKPVELKYGVDFVAQYNGKELTADEYSNLINGYTDPIKDVVEGLKLNVLNENVGKINASVAVAEPGSDKGETQVEGDKDVLVNGMNTPVPPTTAPTTEPTTEPTSGPTSAPTKTPSRPGSLGSTGSSSSSSSDDDWYWAMMGTTTTTPGFSVKLSAAELAKGGTPTYGGSLNGNVFKADVKVNGTARTSFTGFDPVLAKATYTLPGAQNLYNVVAVNQATGEIVKRSIYNGSQMNAALKDTAVQYAIVEQPLASYDDVSQAWAREAISALSVRNIIAGVGNNLYDPDANVTRAQFAKMIVEAMDILDTTATADFTDVAADAWYAPYVATAQKLGIVTGVGYGMFDPDASITRQDMATMLFRAADVLSIPLASTAAVVTYADEAGIAEYAKTPVYRMQQADIMKGVGDSMFAPQDYTTRAQAAVAIFNIFKVSMTNMATWNF